MNTNTTKVTDCTVLRLPFADKPRIEQVYSGRHPKSVVSLKSVRKRRVAMKTQQCKIVEQLSFAYRQIAVWSCRAADYEQELYGVRVKQAR